MRRPVIVLFLVILALLAAVGARASSCYCQKCVPYLLTQICWPVGYEEMGRCRCQNIPGVGCDLTGSFCENIVVRP
jgi:hypothetical protein